MLRQVATAALLVFASCRVLAASNEFTNQTVGFSLTKPDAWRFATAQENFENLRKTKLRDAELQEAMVKYASAPLVIVVKYPEPYDDINPSFKVSIRPLGQLEGRSAQEIAGMVLPSLDRSFKDFVVVQAPSDVTVSGLSAAYLRVTYLLEVPGVGAFPASSELWIVPRGDYFFMLTAGTRVDEKTGSRQEIQDILKTVRIDP